MEQETKKKNDEMKDQLLVERVIFTRWYYFWIPSTSKRMAGVKGFFTPSTEQK